MIYYSLQENSAGRVFGYVDLRNGSMDADKEREDGVHMNMNTKIEELLAVLKKKEDDKQKNTVLWVLAIIGAVAAVAGIAFAVYRFFAPDYLEDFKEDFDDDFDDYFEDEEE